MATMYRVSGWNSDQPVSDTAASAAAQAASAAESDAHRRMRVRRMVSVRSTLFTAFRQLEQGVAAAVRELIEVPAGSQGVGLIVPDEEQLPAPVLGTLFQRG